jgi:hypothetical protein
VGGPKRGHTSNTNVNDSPHGADRNEVTSRNRNVNNSPHVGGPKRGHTRNKNVTTARTWADRNVVTGGPHVDGATCNKIDPHVEVV